MDFSLIEPRYVIYFAMFIGVMLLVEALRQFMSPEDDTDMRKSKRIRALTDARPAEVLAVELKSRKSASLLERIPYFGNIPARMRQAGMTMRPRMLVMVSALVTALIFAVLVGKTGAVIALAAAFGVGMFLPMTAINFMRNKRIDAFSRQLPDALDLMKRGLSVGHPVSVTIQNVARSMKDPIASEFAKMADQVAYGDTLPDAVLDMAERIDQEDVYYLAASIEIQYGSGGNLGTMLGTLSKVIRARFAMRRRIRAFSSEGRISATILTAMPFIMYGGTKLTAPTYYTSVMGDPLFWPMVGGICFFVVGNGLMLNKLVKFKF